MNLTYVEKSIEGTKLRGKLCEIAVLSKITCLLETSLHMSRWRHKFIQNSVLSLVSAVMTELLYK